MTLFEDTSRHGPSTPQPFEAQDKPALERRAQEKASWSGPFGFRLRTGGMTVAKWHLACDRSGRHKSVLNAGSGESNWLEFMVYWRGIRRLRRGGRHS